MSGELDSLKQRLARLGVSLASMSDTSHADGGQPDAGQKLQAATAAKQLDWEQRGRNTKDVAELLDRINHVERGLYAADALTSATAARFQAQALQSGTAAAAAAAAVDALAGPTARKAARSPLSRPTRKPGANAKPGTKAAGARASVVAPPRAPFAAANAARGAVGARTDLLRGVPSHTPLSTVLHQYKEAEVVWAQEKAALRREVEEHRKRANRAEAEAKRLGCVAEHRSLDAKSLRTALKNRDVQLEASIERIKELEALLGRTQEEAAVRATALAAERDDCKALLVATLQRLETVDEIVHRADMSSSMMQDKMKALEDERLRALEAAARARTEVAELTESRRKLQWQSKLLEKMSEVQLKHNKRKSESIRKLLAREEQGGGEAGLAGSDLLDQHSIGTTELEAIRAGAGGKSGTRYGSLTDLDEDQDGGLS